MSVGIHARLVGYSSIVGQSITLHNGFGGEVIAQLSILTPAGPPPGEDHKTYARRIAQSVADAINDRDAQVNDIRKLDEVVRLLGIGEEAISPADEIRRRFGDQL